jgi:transcriptional regulator GlxA family with amidase domain
MSKIVAILALPGVQLLDVSGPLDVFAQANLEVSRQVYSLKVIACEVGPITSSSGARLLPDFVAGEPIGKLDTFIVAGAPHAPNMHFKAELLSWMSSCAEQSRRFGSVCTGAFALAAAGLLDGRRITTHWACVGQMVLRYPLVKVEEDALHVRDGKLRTSAGVTAGLDLALTLVEEDLGRDVAMRVASQLVMFFKRPGGQTQFSRKGGVVPSGRSVLQEVQRWVAANPGQPLGVEAMAAHAGLSSRHFARLFQAEVGVTPAAWVEATRVAAARALLESGKEAPKQVAVRCGFANIETFRRAFTKHVGVSPAEYRKRYA